MLKVKVTWSCPTLCNPMDYSPWNSPGQNLGVGSCSLLQGIFLIQGLNPGLLHYCRRILYQLSYQGRCMYVNTSIKSLLNPSKITFHIVSMRISILMFLKVIYVFSAKKNSSNEVYTVKSLSLLSNTEKITFTTFSVFLPK